MQIIPTATRTLLLLSHFVFKSTIVTATAAAVAVTTANTRPEYDLSLTQKSAHSKRGLNQNDNQEQPIIPSSLKNLVILFNFKDENNANNALPFTRNNYENLFNGGCYPNDDICPTGSVRDYFKSNSIDSAGSYFKVDFTVVDWVTIDKTEAQCAVANTIIINTTCLQEALDKVSNNGGINFTEFSTTGNGYIDAITFIHSGDGAYESDTAANIHPGYHNMNRQNITRIGELVYNFARSFLPLERLDDDTDEQKSSGIGNFGLMGGNFDGWNNTGYNPPQLSAWSKKELGWIKITTLDSAIPPTNFTLKPSCGDPGEGEGSEAIMITANFPEGEYLLIENRQPCGKYDADIPQGGLAIWHIDEKKSNNNDQGDPNQHGWPSNGRHKKVSLLQADGKYNLDTTVEEQKNQGDKFDLFHLGGVTSIGPNGISNETSNVGEYPNTDAYQDETITKTGITIIVVDAVDGNPKAEATIITCQIAIPAGPKPPTKPVTKAPKAPKAPTCGKGKGSKAPKGKGTKAPGGKGTKAPGGKGKGTKAPTTEGNRLLKSIKGTKSLHSKAPKAPKAPKSKVTRAPTTSDSTKKCKEEEDDDKKTTKVDVDFKVIGKKVTDAAKLKEKIQKALNGGGGDDDGNDKNRLLDRKGDNEELEIVSIDIKTFKKVGEDDCTDKCTFEVTGTATVTGYDKDSKNAVAELEKKKIAFLTNKLPEGYELVIAEDGKKDKKVLDGGKTSGMALETSKLVDASNDAPGLPPIFIILILGSVGVGIIGIALFLYRRRSQQEYDDFERVKRMYQQASTRNRYEVDESDDAENSSFFDKDMSDGVMKNPTTRRSRSHHTSSRFDRSQHEEQPIESKTDHTSFPVKLDNDDDDDGGDKDMSEMVVLKNTASVLPRRLQKTRSTTMSQRSLALRSSSSSSSSQLRNTNTNTNTKTKTKTNMEYNEEARKALEKPTFPIYNATIVDNEDEDSILHGGGILTNKSDSGSSFWSCGGGVNRFWEEDK